MFTYLPTRDQFTENILPKLEDRQVSCAICGKVFNRLTGTHLRTHKKELETRRRLKWVRKRPEEIESEQEEQPGIDIDPVTQRPETLTETYRRVYLVTEPMSALIEQTFRLYHPRKSEWVFFDSVPESEWTTVHPEDTGWRGSWHSNYLNAEQLKMHFRGEITIGVHPRRRASSWVLVFDVDASPLPEEITKVTEQRTKAATRTLVRLLRRHHLQPHVVASGKKGYHVTLYFDKPITRRLAKRLFDYFVNHPELPTESIVIEFLPFTHAVKLPLGIHQKAQKFCTFVDPQTLLPQKDAYSYFLGIQPMSVNVVTKNFVTEPTALQARPRRSNLDSMPKEDSMFATAYEEGIQQRGTRHTTTLQAAAFYRNYYHPETEFELLQQMLEWSHQQYEEHHNHIRTSRLHHERELTGIVHYVWTHPLSRDGSYRVALKASDVHWIRQQTTSLAAQRLLLAALYQSRLSGEEFHFGFERMRQLTGLAKDSLSVAIKELREVTCVLELTKNYSHQTGIFKAQTAKYRLATVPAASDLSPVLVEVDETSWSQQLWYQSLCMLFSSKELKLMYPHAWHRISKTGYPSPQSRVG